ncbi:GNAT family N-acetyltransferase [Roseomonas sp. BU-1]|uniref:GNAT family N-acetyltransferase n=2 Tax=Falsiroseomonas selenitidurans TaxID=2716335 RepID=A0ABX1EBD7_9PROT|nr:GNAT family N-acetyltransferase [Falsiroseomonas selenitidurans]
MTKRLDRPAAAATPWPDAATPRAIITRGEANLVPVLLAGLSAHAVTQAGPHGHAPFSLAVHPPGEAAPVGGLSGSFFYDWLFIQYFFLPEALRGQGLGRALMQQAEAAARARGCAGIWLDTFSFQALPFYEALGYRQFGRIDDFPPGQSRHYLMKRLKDGEA